MATSTLVRFVAARREHLPRPDAALLEQVFEHGRTLTSIAALTGESPRRLSRHVKLLVKRLTDPGFDAVTRHRSPWPPQMALIGEAVFVRGLSVRAAAAEAGAPYPTARAFVQAVRAIGEELRAGRKGEAA
ncbi:MAG TPA: hypothetical protein VEB22_14790 [Phycisphaerales bacterium]|nr:hypothetical protein [Phycisphaerales bacterium]